MRWVLVVAILAVGTLAFFAIRWLWIGGPTEELTKDDSERIAEIMKDLNGGAKGIHYQLGKWIGDTQIDWKEMKPLTQKYADLAEELTQLSPAEGKIESWKALTASYAEQAKVLHSGVETQQIDTIRPAYELLRKSCKTCHDRHR
jgi:hypothetical protein